jgi:hypothetical protein
MKGHTEQPPFAGLSVDLAPNIQKGVRALLSLLHNLDNPDLLNDKEPSAAITGVGEVERLVEGAVERFQHDRQVSQC